MRRILRPDLRMGFFLVRGLLLALALLPPAASAEWKRYENAHFIAYSSAAERTVLPLLLDLEHFRAAFLQIGNITIPAGAPKTIVLLTATNREFQKVNIGRNVGAYAARFGDRTLIVMPVTSQQEWSRTVIRHEYGHALLRYKNFDYPDWYEEGFAELVSTVEIEDGGGIFILGKPPVRAVLAGTPQVDWDALVADGIRLHGLSGAKGSSAYAQSWLLAHYTTLGDDSGHAPQLQNYFDRLRAGEASGDAFIAAFGQSPRDLWNQVLKGYTTRIPYLRIPYRSGAMDPEYAITTAPDGEIGPLVDDLELRTRMLFRQPRPPKDALERVTGNWTAFQLGGGCPEYLRFSVDKAARTLAVQTSSGSADAKTFRYSVRRDRTILFEHEAMAPDDGDVPVPDAFVLKSLERDVMCVGPAAPDTGCDTLLRRCAQVKPAAATLDAAVPLPVPPRR